jgi:hypothetical protein
LNDHLAGSLIAIEILEHLETEASDFMPDLPALKADIEADRQQLKMLMDRLGITGSRVRKLTSWIAEQVTEAKFEADDESRGTLRRLERLEALGIRIDGKSALWWALNAAAEVAPDLRGTDYKHLAQRAQEQRGRVEICDCKPRDWPWCRRSFERAENPYVTPDSRRGVFGLQS